MAHVYGKLWYLNKPKSKIGNSLFHFYFSKEISVGIMCCVDFIFGQYVVHELVCCYLNVRRPEFYFKLES